MHNEQIDNGTHNSMQNIRKFYLRTANNNNINRKAVVIVDFNFNSAIVY